MLNHQRVSDSSKNIQFDMMSYVVSRTVTMAGPQPQPVIGQDHEISCSAPSGSYCVDFDQGCPATCKNEEYECKRTGLKAGQADSRSRPCGHGQELRRLTGNEHIMIKL